MQGIFNKIKFKESIAQNRIKLNLQLQMNPNSKRGFPNCKTYPCDSTTVLMNSQKVSRFVANLSRAIEEGRGTRVDSIPATHITTQIIFPQLQPTKGGNGPSAKQMQGRSEQYDSKMLGVIPLNCSGTPCLAIRQDPRFRLGISGSMRVPGSRSSKVS
jgi:hypothetical protein